MKQTISSLKLSLFSAFLLLLFLIPGKVWSQSDTPDWVRLMRTKNANVLEVMRLRDAWCETRECEQREGFESEEGGDDAWNQEFERWIRKVKPITPQGYQTKPDYKRREQQDRQYLDRFRQAQNAMSKTGSGTWESVGPFRTDQEASTNYGNPGSGHLYVTRRAPDNANVVYAGCAGCGVWKTTDAGANWLLMTKDELVTEVYAMAVVDANTVYFGNRRDQKIYKTTNGGTSWTKLGGTTFSDLDVSFNDIVAGNTSTNILFTATDEGLFRSADDGSNWNLIMGGDWQEVEFKPGDDNTVYAVRVAKNHTEFWKSIDGGLTFGVQSNGWPGIGSATNLTGFSALANGGNATIQFAADPELGSGSNTDFTIEMRVRQNEYTYWSTFLGNAWWYGNNTKGMAIGVGGGGGLQFHIADGTTQLNLSTSHIADGEWHQIAVVYRATGQKELWLDGALVASSNTNIATTTNSTDPLRMYAFAAGYDLNADIAQLRIWNTALSSTTLNSYWNVNVPTDHPNYANLLHEWRFTEGTGTSIGDSKGTNTGTVSGAGSSWLTNQTMTRITEYFSNAGDEQRRTEIAVTPADPNRVYALLSGVMNGGSGLVGVYRSDDGGETWTHKCCGTGPGGTASSSNPNILSYAGDGVEEGGQYYYDLTLGVSPTNADDVYTGGIAVWKSTDGGSTFSNLMGRWYWVSSQPDKYIHADVHDINIYPDGSIWVACDGGAFYSPDNGATFRQRHNGIQASDFWGFAIHPFNNEVMIGGTYHNGTLMKDGATFDGGWVHVGGGDDYFGAASPIDDRTLFARNLTRYQLSGIRLDGWDGFSVSKTMNQGASAMNSSNLAFKPNCGQCFYLGSNDEIWYTSDNGASFTLTKDFGNGYNVTRIEVAYSNANTIYAAQYGAYNNNNRKLWRSDDGGQNWTDITPTAEVGGLNNAGFDFVVDSQDANTLWLTKRHEWGWNYYNGVKVYKSDNGGTSWTNLSTSTLDDQHINTIVHKRGSNGGVYIGTDKTVYYRNNSMSDWAAYSNGLPAITPTRYLGIDYRNSKIVAATYGRSVYRADLYEAPTVQAGLAVAETTSNCSRDSFTIYDQSVASASSTRSWTFTDGNPATSNALNPTISFTSGGSKSISLSVTENGQTSHYTANNLLTITDGCAIEALPVNALSLTTNSSYATTPALNQTSNTITLMGWIKPNGQQASNAGLFFSGSGGATGLNLKGATATESELGYHWANSSGSYNFSSGLQVPVNQWSHVALVVNGTSAKLYLNGKAATRTATHNAVNFSSGFNLGNDRGNSSRTFKGLMEEIRIYNRALSQEEIRERMHLTGNVGSDANLVSYYQFNESAGKILDRIGTAHATLNGSASRASSAAPVATGVSNRQTVIASGVVSFGTTGVTIDFSSGGTLPNGEIAVSRLDAAPNVDTGITAKSRSYWVIENFGTNASFTNLNSITFSNIGNVTASDVASPNRFKLYKRDSRADDQTWTLVGTGTSAIAGSDGSVTFGSSSITSFSQFLITNEEGSSLPITLAAFQVAATTNHEVSATWATHSETKTDHYILERSKDQTDWEKVATLPAKGESGTIQNYELRDPMPRKGTTWYRLKTMNRDGSSQISSIQELTLETLGFDLATYPNPAPRNTGLNIANGMAGTATFMLYDVQGRKVKTVLVEDRSELNIADLPAGMYFWMAQTKSKIKTGRIVVE